jgi:hypothetical protein
MKMSMKGEGITGKTSFSLSLVFFGEDIRFFFSGPLASRNPNTGNNSKPIGFQNRFDAFDKRKNNRGFEHKNNFQEVNQQNSSTRFFRAHAFLRNYATYL